MTPTTSTTLLSDLASDSRHARWTDFVRRYRPFMEAYLRRRFPSLDADEVVAETLIALVDILRDYRYNPSELGSFHNYLTGVLRHKALHLCRANDRMNAFKEHYRSLSDEPPSPLSDEAEEEAYRQGLLEVALSQFFANATIAPRTKEIFRRVALAGESPDAVAKSFRIERHAVDQIKSRSVARLREIILELERADDGR